MEKVNGFLIIFLLISIGLSAQEYKNSDNKSITYIEYNVEVGIDQSLLKNDTISQKFATSPYILFQYENYYTDRLRLNLMLVPVAIHKTKDETQLFKERCFQPEFGISGSYLIYGNLWFTAGVGYAYRLSKQYRRGAGEWTAAKYKQPGPFVYSSVDYWIRPSLGLKVTSVFNKEGYTFRIGIFVNFEAIERRSRNNNEQ
ncbi:MAG TPA: hypothetical protein PLS84_01055 [Salinivirgaceae bacterium]|nr:hypothetical protein [Salinivirgaceae bacterium]